MIMVTHLPTMCSLLHMYPVSSNGYMYPVSVHGYTCTKHVLNVIHVPSICSWLNKYPELITTYHHYRMPEHVILVVSVHNWQIQWYGLFKNSRTSVVNEQPISNSVKSATPIVRWLSTTFVWPFIWTAHTNSYVFKVLAQIALSNTFPVVTS